MTYEQVSKLIKDNNTIFNDSEQIDDFISNYSQADNVELDDLEDNLTEYADGLVPIYYYDITKQWQDTTDCHEMTKEVCGEYGDKATIYEMMSSDLFYYYEQELREDYEKLKDLIDEQETKDKK